MIIGRILDEWYLYFEKVACYFKKGRGIARLFCEIDPIKVSYTVGRSDKGALLDTDFSKVVSVLGSSLNKHNYQF